MIPGSGELPTQLYRAVQVQRLDKTAIEQFQIPGETLMERAGAAAFALLCTRWPKAQRICVLCGVGNNGGDGFVVARLAHGAGLSVRVMQVGALERIGGDADAMRKKLIATGADVGQLSASALGQADVVVDALLGTGLKGEVTGEWLQAITAINNAGRPVLAIDIPSGLHADTGRVLGAAVRADATISFIGLKQGLFTGHGPDYAGVVAFDALAVPVAVYRGVPTSATRLSDDFVQQVLGPRARTAHKGDFGHALIVGGDHGMGGAARLAAESAARVGAGLVSVATRASHVVAINAGRPELMCSGVASEQEIRPMIDRASVIGIGPGLGQSEWSRKMFAAAMASKLPLVVDADGLNLLAQAPAQRDNWVLTPHPGEAARLIGHRVADIQNDRFAAARELQQRFGGVVVLKGAGTLVATPDLAIALCNAGNPGMASGGMGDVLTGVIAGFIAQGFAPKDAAYLGVQVHAMAGDRAARDGERGLLAGDVMEQLRGVVNFGT
jgi:NAD(P)H-hydrate epimerase